jgi:hypothetical protein
MNRILLTFRRRGRTAGRFQYFAGIQTAAVEIRLETGFLFLKAPTSGIAKPWARTCASELVYSSG